MNMLPVLAQQNDIRIVEVSGQPVVTARDLARALGYVREDAVRKLLNRNWESFKERKGGPNLTPPCDTGEKERWSQIDSPFKTGEMEKKENEDCFDLATLKNSELKYDTGEVEIDTPGGQQRVRYFTKRGALKICMKSNQPKAIMVQEMLIDLYEQVERGELVSVGYLSLVVQSLRQEVNRLSDIVTAAGISPGPQVIYLPRPKKRHSFSDNALIFLQELFNQRPRARVSELDRWLRSKAAKEGWKVGSRASVYRAIKGFKNGCKENNHVKNIFGVLPEVSRENEYSAAKNY